MKHKVERKGYEKGGNGFGLVLNSQLDCKDCIYVYEPDTNTGECAVFHLKPTKVLNGGKCDKKETE